jgi:hypothetical protein
MGAGLAQCPKVRRIVGEAMRPSRLGNAQPKKFSGGVREKHMGVGGPHMFFPKQPKVAQAPLTSFLARFRGPSKRMASPGGYRVSGESSAAGRRM